MALRTDGVSEEVSDADAKSENELFGSQHGAFVRLIEKSYQSLGERLQNCHRVAEQTETEHERVQMPQHLEQMKQFDGCWYTKTAY